MSEPNTKPIDPNPVRTALNTMRHASARANLQDAIITFRDQVHDLIRRKISNEHLGHRVLARFDGDLDQLAERLASELR